MSGYVNGRIQFVSSIAKWGRIRDSPLGLGYGLQTVWSSHPWYLTLSVYQLRLQILLMDHSFPIVLPTHMAISVVD